MVNKAWSLSSHPKPWIGATISAWFKPGTASYYYFSCSWPGTVAASSNRLSHWRLLYAIQSASPGDIWKLVTLVGEGLRTRHQEHVVQLQVAIYDLWYHFIQPPLTIFSSSSPCNHDTHQHVSVYWQITWHHGMLSQSFSHNKSVVSSNKSADHRLSVLIWRHLFLGTGEL